MPGKQTQRGDAGRAYSLGFELVCAVAGFLLVGIWIDRHFGSGPAGTLICLFLGLIGGFYNLFRGASRLAAPPVSPPSSSAAQPAAPRAPGPAEAHPGAGRGTDGPAPGSADPAAGRGVAGTARRDDAPPR